jgi:hypothetical protein
MKLIERKEAHSGTLPACRSFDISQCVRCFGVEGGDFFVLVEKLHCAVQQHMHIDPLIGIGAIGRLHGGIFCAGVILSCFPIPLLADLEFFLMSKLFTVPVSAVGCRVLQG